IVIYAQQHFYRLQEMLNIIVGMEADEVGAHDAMQQGLFPLGGQEAENLVRGERDVQEKTDRRFRSFLPQQMRKEHQLIIVYPHLVTRLQQRHDFFREKLVHLNISVKILAFIIGKVGKIMKKR